MGICPVLRFGRRVRLLASVHACQRARTKWNEMKRTYRVGEEGGLGDHESVVEIIVVKHF